MKAVLASHNRKKMEEMRQILSQLGVEVISQADAGVDLEPEETGTTFAENARINQERMAAEALAIMPPSFTPSALAKARSLH